MYLKSGFYPTVRSFSTEKSSAPQLAENWLLISVFYEKCGLGDKLLGRLTRAMNALGGLRADSGKLAEHSELPPVYQVVRLLGQIEVLKGEIKALMR